MPIEGMEAFPTDHLPALIRKRAGSCAATSSIPTSRCPSSCTSASGTSRWSACRAPGTEEFWSRRDTPTGWPASRSACCIPPDALAYAALHLLKHVLRGSVKAFHVYEIARDARRARGQDEASGREWRELHPPGLRRLRGSSLSAGARVVRRPHVRGGQDEIAQLPAATQSWFDGFALSPATQEFHRIRTSCGCTSACSIRARDAWRVARRRPASRQSAAVRGYGVRARRPGHVWPTGAEWIRWTAYTAGRLRHHAFALPQTALSGLRCWWSAPTAWASSSGSSSPPPRCSISRCSSSSCIQPVPARPGLPRGFRGRRERRRAAWEAWLGTLPAAWVAHRFGLRRTLIAESSRASA